MFALGHSDMHGALFMHEKIQYPPQRILSASQSALHLENQHSRLVHTARVSEWYHKKLTKAEKYAKKRGGNVLAKPAIFYSTSAIH